THVNVRPIAAWVHAMADRGFAPVPGSHADVVSPQAIVFERGSRDAEQLAAAYETAHARLVLERQTAERERMRAEAAWNEARSRVFRTEADLHEARSGALEAERWQREAGRWQLEAERARVVAERARLEAERARFDAETALTQALAASPPPGLYSTSKWRRRWEQRRGHINHGRILVRRTRDVLLEEGPIEVIRRARNWT